MGEVEKNDIFNRYLLPLGFRWRRKEGRWEGGREAGRRYPWGWEDTMPYERTYIWYSHFVKAKQDEEKRILALCRKEKEVGNNTEAFRACCSSRPIAL